ncbi:hypothetical protein [Clostridium sartagoforme]|uniref:hypothetical protein n=1 Tax=Clostridium sartagoforme TaxID=84031 RepID=UPI0031CF9721
MALGADVACAILPFATGGGAAVRAATKVDDVVDTVKAVDKGSSVVKGANKAPKMNYLDEVKAPNPVRTKNVTSEWDNFLGKGPHSNINPYTNNVDSNRIFSADGARSIRFGNHEMGSYGTNKFHYHEEIWGFNPSDNIVDVSNLLRRIAR